MTMKAATLLTLFTFCSCAFLAFGSPSPQAKPADAALTNDQIIEMVKAMLAPSLIISQIRGSKTNFNFSTDELIRLSNAGVSESIIEVMRNPQGPAGATVGDLPGNKLKLADGEKVRLVLMQDISSSTANQGDRINLAVAEDVKVGDIVVIAKGAMGLGSISEAKKKGMLGRGGKLTMALEYVKAVDGQNVRVRANAGREGDDKTGKTVAVAVLAGPFALLVKGKDVVSTKGTEYTAYVDEAKDILVSQ